MQSIWYFCLLIYFKTIHNIETIYVKVIMSNQNSQSHKRQEKNTEWLDELINQIEEKIRHSGEKI
mgnify:FL=1